jgi:hypothetical protein
MVLSWGDVSQVGRHEWNKRDGVGHTLRLCWRLHSIGRGLSLGVWLVGRPRSGAGEKPLYGV